MKQIEPAEIFRDRPLLMALATELAVGFLEEKEALELYSVTKAEYEVIKNNPAFKKVLEAEKASWNTPLNVEARTQLKAQYLVEQLLPEINARLYDRSEDLNKVVNAAQWLTKLAGLDKGPAGVDVRDKFLIQINMGGGAEIDTAIALTPAIPEQPLDKAPEFCLVTAQSIEDRPDEAIQISCEPPEGEDIRRLDGETDTTNQKRYNPGRRRRPLLPG